MSKKFISLILVGVLLLSLCACEVDIKKVDKPEESKTPESLVDISNMNVFDKSAIMVDKLYDDGENIMISPVSLYTALGVVMNGANGNTKTELEQFVGMDTEMLNKIIDKLMSVKVDPDDDKSPTVKMANGIWVKDEKGKYNLSSDFKKIVDNIYKGTVKMADMGLETVEDINNFTNENTNKMIPQIINEIDSTTVAILVNALYFEAVWDDMYEEYQVREDVFNGLDEQSNVEMMSCMEKTYFENDKAIGFAKKYIGPYEFIAVLPKEEGDFDIEDLDITTFLKSRTRKFDVYTKLPKFEYDWGNSLVDMMKTLGVKDAFNETVADFKDMFEELPEDENIYISDIIQKTRIELSESGTKAAAVTMITMDRAMAAKTEEIEIKEVILDRPFVFIIRDIENDLPLFIGKVVNL